jgi:Glu/Leu/Phe/Val dehydrogenase, dimerisation domain
MPPLSLASSAAVAAALRRASSPSCSSSRRIGSSSTAVRTLGSGGIPPHQQQRNGKNGGVHPSVAAQRIRSHSSTSAATAAAVDTTANSGNSSNGLTTKKSLITGNDTVHSTMKVGKSWRNKPLFRRQGDVRFKTGMEASQLLVKEAMRRDPHELPYIDSVVSTVSCLATVFDRNPKYAFCAKTLMEPERSVQFRVAWMDDVGVVRMNRGWRIQYNSALGEYSGGLHFGPHLTNATIKAVAYDAVFSNALTGFPLGASGGGSDFNPVDKSEAELQRFCQSYMTELAKYVGPGQDAPWMGTGVGREEMGYLYGQYKRLRSNSSGGGGGSGTGGGGAKFLSGEFHEVRCNQKGIPLVFVCVFLRNIVFGLVFHLFSR